MQCRVGKSVSDSENYSISSTCTVPVCSNKYFLSLLQRYVYLHARMVVSVWRVITVNVHMDCLMADVMVSQTRSILHAHADVESTHPAKSVLCLCLSTLPQYSVADLNG